MFDRNLAFEIIYQLIWDPDSYLILGILLFNGGWQLHVQVHEKGAEDMSLTPDQPFSRTFYADITEQTLF